MDSHTVLVLEDDEATAAFLADNLTADGFRVATAGGAGEGWRAIELRHPELLVLDLGLADGSGLELLDRLRSADRIASRVDPGLPVIVVSGRASEVDRVRGLARGADDYLAKPFSYPGRNAYKDQEDDCDNGVRPAVHVPAHDVLVQ